MRVIHHLTVIGGISSVTKRSKIFHFLHLLIDHVNLNSTEGLAEMDWKNFEKDEKFFGAALKTW